MVITQFDVKSLKKMSLEELIKLKHQICYLIKKNTKNPSNLRKTEQEQKIEYFILFLKKFRKINMTLEEIADKMHCSPRTLSYWYDYLDGKRKRPKYCKVGSYTNTKHDQRRDESEPFRWDDSFNLK